MEKIKSLHLALIPTYEHISKVVDFVMIFYFWNIEKTLHIFKHLRTLLRTEFLLSEYFVDFSIPEKSQYVIK